MLSAIANENANALSTMRDSHDEILTLGFCRCFLNRDQARCGPIGQSPGIASGTTGNIHFHILFLDGVYVDGVNGSAARFRNDQGEKRGERLFNNRGLREKGLLFLLAWPAATTKFTVIR